MTWRIAIRSHDVDQAAEVEVGCAKTDEAFQSGERDPGEGGQIDANDELECGAAKDDFWQGGGALDPGDGDQSDANVELQGPEMEMRFVSWVSGSLTMNSDFG